MYATIRRFEGVDTTRTDELVKQVDENLRPKLSELPGFVGYYLVDPGYGVMTSVSFFDTSAHADASTEASAAWVREQQLDSALPNAPKIMGGEILVHETSQLVQA
jgi:hypothetical protein